MQARVTANIPHGRVPLASVRGLPVHMHGKSNMDVAEARHETEIAAEESPSLGPLLWPTACVKYDVDIQLHVF